MDENGFLLLLLLSIPMQLCALESNVANIFFTPHTAAKEVAFEPAKTLWAEQCLIECVIACHAYEMELDIPLWILGWTYEEDCDYRLCPEPSSVVFVIPCIELGVADCQIRVHLLNSDQISWLVCE